MNSIKKILSNYNDYLMQIKIIKNQIQYYTELLKLSDLSQFDYYRQKIFLGIKYTSPIYSTVEKEAFKKDKIHKLNYEIIFDLRNIEQKKLLKIKKQVQMVNSAISRLNEQDRFIIKCKYIDNRNLTYKDIIENIYTKFKFYFDERTIKRRVKKAITLIEKNLNDCNIDLNNTINYNKSYLNKDVLNKTLLL
jgi:hypothetical protein